jgi:type II secretory pathway pseudopilin PulG
MPTGRAFPRIGRGGFTLVYLLMLVVVVGILSTAAARGYSRASLREREEELLFRGMQYREAIGRYVRYMGRIQYPNSIDSLLKDPRTPGTVRHLRRRYADPVTGEDFQPIKSKEGWVIGVRSASEKEPAKLADFPPGLEAFTGKRKYRDWEFVYRYQAVLPPGHPPVGHGAMTRPKSLGR